MNRKRSVIIIVVGIIIMISVSAIVLLTRKTSTIEQKFHIEEVSKISKVTLEGMNNTKMTLERKSDTVWFVNNEFEAAPMMVSTLLETFESIRVREPVAKAARINIIKQLATSNTKVDIYVEDYFINWGFIKLFKRERLLKTLYIGGETMDNMGTYMSLKGDDAPYVIYIPNFRGYLSTRFTSNPDDWKPHTIFKYKPEDIASIKVEIPQDPSESFELYSEGKTFHLKLLKTGEKLPVFDTIKITSFLSSFANLSYENIEKDPVSKIQKDSVFSKSPSFVLTVKDKKGKEKQLSTYVKLNQDTWVSSNDKSDFYEIFDVNKMYGLVGGGKDTLILQYFAFDNVLKPASYFFQKK